VTGVSNQIVVKSRPDTARIKSDIMVALDRSWFNPAAINVAASGGQVTLTGSVDSWYERDEATSTAWAAPGTTSVHNEIVVS
jgi:osmotically-inducible protein OsmY